MTVVETLLVFAGIPAAIVVLIAIAVFGKSAVRQPSRYRPGKPWEHAPAWFVPHPDAVRHDVVTGARQLEGNQRATSAVGGASGEW